MIAMEIYDAMQRVSDSGEPYKTLLDPPPADPAWPICPAKRAPAQ